jgi:hypothetical protein
VSELLEYGRKYLQLTIKSRASNLIPVILYYKISWLVTVWS